MTAQKPPIEHALAVLRTGGSFAEAASLTGWTVSEVQAAWKADQAAKAEAEPGDEE